MKRLWCYSGALLLAALVAGCSGSGKNTPPAAPASVDLVPAGTNKQQGLGKDNKPPSKEDIEKYRDKVRQGTPQPGPPR